MEAGKTRFIVSLNPAGWLTMFGLALDLAAFFIFIDIPALAWGRSFSETAGPEPLFFLGVGLMYLGMLADAFDGIVARKFRLETEFGRYLDGFVDVFNYLVLPNLALWKLGFSGPWAGGLIGVMIAAGILRLSKFNMIGNIKHEGTSKYLGMPVFWSQLFFFPLYILFALFPARVFWLASALLWPVMSMAFVYNRPFFKPRNPWIISGLISALAASAIALFLLGRHP